ncbi:MAG: hypothetical protein ACRDQ4_11255 [Pseudonocardiaceae bacterium]
MTTFARPPVEVGKLLGFGTSTVGIITALGRHAVNVMSAEWTYLVAKRPPHFAVGCQTTNYTTRLILGGHDDTHGRRWLAQRRVPRVLRRGPP